ncbi:MAG: hypothetical protein ACP5HG_10150 [Anaerolineae bacterium]
MTDPVRFEETFEDQLSEGWSWIHEAPEAWHIKDQELHLQTLPGTLWGERNDARNILLRPALELEPGLASEVQVTNAPVLQGEQAGLIWYLDEGNYIKLVKERLDDRIWIVLAREENEQPALVNRVPFLPQTARLRLTLVQERVVGQVLTPEDSEWQTVGECDPISTPMLQFGIFTHGGPNDTRRSAQFSSFKVYRLES